MKRRGFTFAEMMVATALSVLLLSLIASGVIWVRHGIRVIASVDQDASLLWLHRIANRELNNARSYLFPPFEEDGGVREEPQLVFTDASGDVCMIFLDRDLRLIQYSHSRRQFRDLLVGVSQFRVRRPGINTVEYTISRQVGEQLETVRGVFSVPSIYKR